MIIKRTAVKVKQGSLDLYATSLKVSDLMINDFYQVDKLDSNNDSSGYQRLLDKTRAKRLADYINEASKDGDAFLPTSILIATDKSITYDVVNKEIIIDTDLICPFNVVDGQHRVEGLKEAAIINPEIRDFEVITNIAVNLDEISQMCHFLIVNTTQKPVDRSVEQQIIARLTSMVDIEDVPTLPKWIQKQVLKGEDKEALIIANYLNSEKDSPWYGKILMANEARDEANTINQKSFVQSVKMYILSASNPLSAFTDIDKRNKILKNYWKAIAELLIDNQSNESSVVFKTIGLELFNIVSTTVFSKLAIENDFRVEKIKEIINHGLQNLPNDYLSVQHADWWKSGGGASGINKAAVRHIAAELNKAMYSQVKNDEIKL